MDTYVITLSQVFPVTHSRKGEPTGFKDKFLNAIKAVPEEWWKLHTIRANCDLWKKRFEKIEKGEACLSIRQWAGKPYRSKQVEIARLTREDGIGIEIVKFTEHLECQTIYCNNDFFRKRVTCFRPNDFSHNDGLSLDDWKEWFKSYDLSKPLAIIHFTSFRYWYENGKGTSIGKV